MEHIALAFMFDGTVSSWPQDDKRLIRAPRIKQYSVGSNLTKLVKGLDGPPLEIALRLAIIDSLEVVREYAASKRWEIDANALGQVIECFRNSPEPR